MGRGRREGVLVGTPETPVLFLNLFKGSQRKFSVCDSIRSDHHLSRRNASTPTSTLNPRPPSSPRDKSDTRLMMGLPEVSQLFRELHKKPTPGATYISGNMEEDRLFCQALLLIGDASCP